MKLLLLGLFLVFSSVSVKSQPYLIGKSRKYIMDYQASESGVANFVNVTISKDSTVFMYFISKADSEVRMFYKLDRNYICDAYTYAEPIKNISSTIYTLNTDDIIVDENKKWLTKSKEFMIELIHKPGDSYYYVMYYKV